MKIIDCFMLNDELDMLEYRLSSLYDHVDHFVLVESNVTHRGAPKPMFYALYKDRFEKYNDKIIHVLTTDIPKKLSDKEARENTIHHSHPYIYREQLQRSKILEGLRELSLDFEDIVLVSNLDEIPNPSSFSKLPNYLSMSPVIFRQKWYVWNHTMKRNKKWYGTSAFYYSHILRDNDILNKTRLVNEVGNFDDYFYLDYGWHFSWFGDLKRQINKIYSSSHYEYNHPFYQRKKSFRDLSKNKRFPNPIPTRIEYLSDSKISELPSNYTLLPHHDCNNEPNVYDTVIYNGEFELLKIRLEELYNVVDYFIILEGNYNKDEYLYPQISDELEEYDDKIIYVQLEDYDSLGESIHLYEMDKIKETISFLELKDNDFIYYSDIDYIPSYETIEINYFDFEVYELDFVTLKMRWFYENYNREVNSPHWGTILTTWEKLKDKSLSSFYLLRDEPVHSIIHYRGWFLCNFDNNYHEIDLKDVRTSSPNWDYYPFSKKHEDKKELLIDFN